MGWATEEALSGLDQQLSPLAKLSSVELSWSESHQNCAPLSPQTGAPQGEPRPLEPQARTCVSPSASGSPCRARPEHLKCTQEV